MGLKLHIHRYKISEPWHEQDWGGIRAWRRVKTCRCGANKVVVRGTLPNERDERFDICNCSVHDITRIGAAHADDCPMAD